MAFNSSQRYDDHRSTASRSSKRVLQRTFCRAQILQRILVNCNRPTQEQNNAVIKDDGGAIGLTEDPTALRRWMIAGPEVSRLVATISSKHHEQGESAVDGSALVNSQPPRRSKTFDDYANEDILSRVRSYSTKYQRIDIVFDVYKVSSLKVETRSKRGKGIRRRVTPTSKTPQNWKSFLRDHNNKTELFHFLADRLSKADMPCLVTVTKEEDVCCNRVIALDDLAPCTHEEADSRIFVHARHAAMNGSKA